MAQRSNRTPRRSASAAKVNMYVEISDEDDDDIRPGKRKPGVGKGRALPAATPGRSGRVHGAGAASLPVTSGQSSASRKSRSHTNISSPNITAKRNVDSGVKQYPIRSSEPSGNSRTQRQTEAKDLGHPTRSRLQASTGSRQANPSGSDSRHRVCRPEHFVEVSSDDDSSSGRSVKGRSGRQTAAHSAVMTTRSVSQPHTLAGKKQLQASISASAIHTSAKLHSLQTFDKRGRPLKRGHASGSQSDHLVHAGHGSVSHHSAEPLSKRARFSGHEDSTGSKALGKKAFLRRAEKDMLLLASSSAGSDKGDSKPVGTRLKPGSMGTDDRKPFTRHALGAASLSVRSQNGRVTASIKAESNQLRQNRGKHWKYPEGNAVSRAGVASAGLSQEIVTRGKRGQPEVGLVKIEDSSLSTGNGGSAVRNRTRLGQHSSTKPEPEDKRQVAKKPIHAPASTSATKVVRKGDNKNSNVIGSIATRGHHCTMHYGDTKKEQSSDSKNVVRPKRNSSKRKTCECCPLDEGHDASSQSPSLSDSDCEWQSSRKKRTPAKKSRKRSGQKVKGVTLTGRTLKTSCQEIQQHAQELTYAYPVTLHASCEPEGPLPTVLHYVGKENRKTASPQLLYAHSSVKEGDPEDIKPAGEHPSSFNQEARLPGEVAYMEEDFYVVVADTDDEDDDTDIKDTSTENLNHIPRLSEDNKADTKQEVMVKREVIQSTYILPKELDTKSELPTNSIVKDENSVKTEQHTERSFSETEDTKPISSWMINSQESFEPEIATKTEITPDAQSEISNNVDQKLANSAPLREKTDLTDDTNIPQNDEAALCTVLNECDNIKGVGEERGSVEKTDTALNDTPRNENQDMVIEQHRSVTEFTHNQVVEAATGTVKQTSDVLTSMECSLDSSITIEHNSNTNPAVQNTNESIEVEPNPEAVTSIKQNPAQTISLQENPDEAITVPKNPDMTKKDKPDMKAPLHEITDRAAMAEETPTLTTKVDVAAPVAGSPGLATPAEENQEAATPVQENPVGTTLVEENPMEENSDSTTLVRENTNGTTPSEHNSAMGTVAEENMDTGPPEDQCIDVFMPVESQNPTELEQNTDIMTPLTSTPVEECSEMMIPAEQHTDVAFEQNLNIETPMEASSEMAVPVEQQSNVSVEQNFDMKTPVESSSEWQCRSNRTYQL